MVTTMETWLIADRQALKAYFPDMKALPWDSELRPLHNLPSFPRRRESRRRGAPLLSYVSAPSFPRKREPTGRGELCKGLELESHGKPDVSRRFAEATQPSRKGRYHKGKHAFDLLGRADPDELRRLLPHFRRFVAALDLRL